MSRRDYYGYRRGRRGSIVFWIFLGIVAFAAIYFPFFGGNSKYQVGSYVSGIFHNLGLCLFIGGLFFIGIGLIRMMLPKGFKPGIKMALLGGILVWIAINFFEPSLWGFITNLEPVPKGYH